MGALSWWAWASEEVGDSGQGGRHLVTLFPDPEHDNTSLRNSNRVRVVKNIQILVGPQITGMNRTAEAHIFELQREWFRFIIDNIVEQCYGLGASA